MPATEMNHVQVLLLNTNHAVSYSQHNKQYAHKLFLSLMLDHSIMNMEITQTVTLLQQVRIPAVILGRLVVVKVTVMSCWVYILIGADTRLIPTKRLDTLIQSAARTLIIVSMV